jgi:hypothetical protein
VVVLDVRLWVDEENEEVVGSRERVEGSGGWVV